MVNPLLARMYPFTSFRNPWADLAADSAREIDQKDTKEAAVCVYTKWVRTENPFWNFSWFYGSRARGAWGKRSSIKRKEKSRKQWSEEKKERESERCSWQYSANGDSAQPQHATRCARETCFSVRDNTKEIQLIAQRCNSSLNLYLSKNGIRWTTMRFVKLLWQVFYGIAW